MPAEEPNGESGGARLAGAIYGTILVMSVVAGVSAATESRAATALVAAVVTSLVFWVAHVYADALATHVTLREGTLSRAKVREIASEDWPLVQAVLPPGVCLMLGVLGIVSDDAAVLLALGAGVVALAVWGAATARRGGAPLSGAIIAATVNVTLGLVIVALKLLVH